MTKYSINKIKNIEEEIELEVIINDNLDVCVRIQKKGTKMAKKKYSRIYLYMAWDDDFDPNS